MPRRLKPLASLQGDQLHASDPREHAALSASAGTGKTHVLTARVLRLLLAGVDPSAILCLTFTKAGAAEMADRVHERLAYWARLDDGALAIDLKALGEKVDLEARERARTLFARVLDAPGGGLRVQTIHAFAQALLAAFPAEADLTPGFRPLEAREESQLARATLAETLVAAEAGGDLGLIRDIQRLSHRLGEGGAEEYMMACARAPDALAALGPREGIEVRLRHAFGLPLGDIEAVIAKRCGDGFARESLDRIAAANRAWNTATGRACCETIATWLAADASGRAASLDGLAALVLTKEGKLRQASPKLIAADPDYADHAAQVSEACAALLALRRTTALVSLFAAGLRAGQAFSAAYAAAKRAAGAVDFDDLIRWTEKLLLTPGIGEWVRYKLDQRTDHILVDEAQDTNERQWNIVRALVLEYFVGEGAHARHRTIFTVGDYKQAIFGFQGTDPQSFDIARAWFSREAAGIDRDFRDLSMDLSFRSAPAILRVVDQVITALGHEALGLPKPANPHLSHHRLRPGAVTLWAPFTDESGSEEAGEEGWISDTARRYAGRLARQIADWLRNPFHVAARKRSLQPEDILILVKRRGDLASLIVARLHAENVPVAGIDRLRLSAPLAVQDLLAAARFAVQPLDDLNLAALLVSPLVGWSQEKLFGVAHDRPGALWAAVRASGDAEALSVLGPLLAMADYAPPHMFLETILSGPLDGRRKLLARLGEEARDPVEELVSSALDFEQSGASSLQAFLDWFARGEVEVVRDPSAPADAVRVMTVHGSKGLQAPVVILADACVDPERAPRRAAQMRIEAEGAPVPLFRPRKDEQVEPLASQIAARDALELQEHWRLLYVALTRAEERLFVGGTLGSKDGEVPPAASWHRAVGKGLELLGAAPGPDALWGQATVFGDPPMAGRTIAGFAVPPHAVPDWVRRPAPAEARPPRPLAPSAAPEDDLPYPPPGPPQREAAERGRLLHSLFERLPGVPAPQRRERALAWLEQAAGVADPAVRRDLVDKACGVIEDPAFAVLFGADALAEAPIAAVLGDGRVVSGTVDRLLVQEERVLVADFKTGRAVPPSGAQVPRGHLRQMAAYAEALAIIFPGRRIEAALLYTAAPVLLHIPAPLLVSTGGGG